MNRRDFFPELFLALVAIEPEGHGFSVYLHQIWLVTVNTRQDGKEAR